MAKKERRAVSRADSKVGQIIGNIFEEVVVDVISNHLDEKHPEYAIYEADGGRGVRLEMAGGLPRQMDNVIALKNSDDPVALFEAKWLKDARHHNDKGAWILQLREVRKNHATIRGAAAVLAGYWTRGVGVMLEAEGDIRMVLVATDEEVYSTLQGPLDEMLGRNTFKLDAAQMRKSFIRPNDLLALLYKLEDEGRLKDIATSWFEFPREIRLGGEKATGGDLVRVAIDDLLAPLPTNPEIELYEVTLHIHTGNVIHMSFKDPEAALQFIQEYYRNPEAILEKITPKANRTRR